MVYNLRSLMNGAADASTKQGILQEVKKLGLVVASGDVSHGVLPVSCNIDRGIELFQ